MQISLLPKGGRTGCLGPDMKNYERRTAPRRRIYQSGMITYDDAQIAVPCIMRNISEEGACLQVVTPRGNSIPHLIHLTFSRDNTGRDCHVVWRDGDRM